MRTIITIAVGISLIILASGTVAFTLDRHANFSGIIGLVMVSLVLFGIFKHVNRQPTKGAQEGPPNEELTLRISALEKRLTDIQDIVISIDDRLSRPAIRKDTPSV